MNLCLCSHLAVVVRSLSAPSYSLPSVAEFLRDDSGQDMIEYALIACFIGFSTVTGLHGLAAQISSYFNIVDNGYTNSLATQ
jgi:pilus assembly protein Flp/PilA